MWAWLKRILWDLPVPAPEPEPYIDRYPLGDHDEATRWCRCGLKRSVHNGCRLCPECDLIERMPNGSWADIVITDDHLPDDAEEEDVD